MEEIRLNVNGKELHVRADGQETLLSVLRNRLEMTGTKYGCGEGECGACTVLLDGKSRHSCRVSVGSAANARITTIEGLAHGDSLTAVQQAFLEEQALQCGYCTSGMIIAATALLHENPHPSEQQIVEFMNGNICRCGTYPRIISAIQRASRSAEGSRA
jgi:aerobic-type carbon monoxide dehydrogenase small subunit (CoxS/CutS family)